MFLKRFKYMVSTTYLLFSALSFASPSTQYDAIQDGDQIYLARALFKEHSEVAWFSNTQKDAQYRYLYNIYVSPDSPRCLPEMPIKNNQCLVSYGHKAVQVPLTQLIRDAFYIEYNITEHTMLTDEEVDYITSRFLNRSRYHKVFRALDDQYFKFEITLEQLLDRSRMNEVNSFGVDDDDAVYLLPILTANPYNSFTAFEYETYKNIQEDMWRFIMQAQGDQEQTVAWLNVYLDMVQNFGRIMIKISDRIDQVITEAQQNEHPALTSENLSFLLLQKKKWLALYFKSLKLLMHDHIADDLTAVILQTGRVKFDKNKFHIEDLEIYQVLFERMLETKRLIAIQDDDGRDGLRHMQQFDSELYDPWYQFDKTLGRLYLPYAVTQDFKNRFHKLYSEYLYQRERDIRMIQNDASNKLMSVLQSHGMDHGVLLDAIDGLSGFSASELERIHRWLDVLKYDLEVEFKLDFILEAESDDDILLMPNIYVDHEVSYLFDPRQGSLLDKSDLKLLVRVLNQLDAKISDSYIFGAQKYSQLYLFRTLQTVFMKHLNIMIEALWEHLDDTNLTQAQKTQLLIKMYYLNQSHIANFIFNFVRLDMNHYPVFLDSVRDYAGFLGYYVGLSYELMQRGIAPASLVKRPVPLDYLIDFPLALSDLDASREDMQLLKTQLSAIKEKSAALK